MFAAYAVSDMDARDGESAMDPHRPPTARERRERALADLADAVQAALDADAEDYAIDRAVAQGRELFRRANAERWQGED